ncbi:sugar ABC transporter permease [Petroclostridium sp. X23]|uniref:carbohydrate ABC transporter permease n=1 Tax=Petroclostridium sp. X23 TaxID=3045146 RepID=UPI0024ADFC57|nr:sugar ABC transporter permease [Petroclostridium sp. X23]WHH61120.1 sugar ABC transporter permease [Petroclostridium sp. X23]
MDTSIETKNTEAILNHDKYTKIPFLVKARPYLIMAPALLITVGFLYPFAAAIYYSMTNFSFRRATYKFIGLENWIDIFKDWDFWHAILVTGKYALATTGIEMLLGLGIALLLSKDNRFTKILKVVLIFPLMIAPVIATLIWQLMTNNSVGILEKFLNIFGIYNFPWASSPKTALFTASLIDIWIYAPFVIILILAGIQSLPKSPFEAAKIDGGSAWFTFRTLTLPMLKPFMYIALIFRLMASLQEFSIIFALTKGGPGNTLMNLSLSSYNTGFAFLKFGKALPYILVLWIVIYIISKKLVGNWLSVHSKASGN